MSTVLNLHLSDSLCSLHIVHSVYEHQIFFILITCRYNASLKQLDIVETSLSLSKVNELQKIIVWHVRDGRVSPLKTIRWPKDVLYYLLSKSLLILGLFIAPRCITEESDTTRVSYLRHKAALRHQHQYVLGLSTSVGETVKDCGPGRNQETRYSVWKRVCGWKHVPASMFLWRTRTHTRKSQPTCKLLPSVICLIYFWSPWNTISPWNRSRLQSPGHGTLKYIWLLILLAGSQAHQLGCHLKSPSHTTWTLRCLPICFNMSDTVYKPHYDAFEKTAMHLSIDVKMHFAVCYCGHHVLWGLAQIHCNLEAR